MILWVVAVDDTVLGPVLRADGYSLSEKIYVMVAGAGVGTIFDEDGIAIVGVVYGGLDVVEISRAVVVNDDGFCDTGAGER